MASQYLQSPRHSSTPICTRHLSAEEWAILTSRVAVGRQVVLANFACVILDDDGQFSVFARVVTVFSSQEDQPSESCCVDFRCWDFLCSRGLFAVLDFYLAFPMEGPDVVDNLASALLILVLVALFCLLLVFKEWGE